jgi:hypothetical protein
MQRAIGAYIEAVCEVYTGFVDADPAHDFAAPGEGEAGAGQEGGDQPAGE